MLQEVVNALRSRPARRAFYCRLGPERIRDDRLKAVPFEIEHSYFELRLAEMHLADARVLFREFLPMCAVVAEFHYGGSRTTVPVIVDNEMIREVLDQIGSDAGHFDLVNTHLLGPVPFMSDRLGLFVGLFRTEMNDYASTLLDVLGDLGEVPALASASSAGTVAYSALRRLLGCESVEPLVGRRSELRVHRGSGEPMESGYLAYVNCDESALSSEELWVIGGRLHRGTGPETASPLTGLDYCLVALEYRANREHFADLPFHDEWLDVKKLVLGGKIDVAEKYAWLRLIGAIKSSHDLTPEDQSAALVAYRLMLEREIDDFERASTPRGDGVARRSARAGRKSGRAGLLEGARIAGARDPGVERSYLELAKVYADSRDSGAAVGEEGRQDDDGARLEALVGLARAQVLPNAASPGVLHDAFVNEVYAAG